MKTKYVKSVYFVLLLISLFFTSCDSVTLSGILELFSTKYSVETTVFPLNSGTVHANSSTGKVPVGTEITFYPIPATGWRFSHWSGDDSSSESPLTLTITNDTYITARFIREYGLSIECEGNGHVTEEVLSDSRTFYEENAQLRLTAVPDEGWVFDHWAGDLSGVQNPIEIDIQDDSQIIAVFIEETSVEWNILVYLDGDNNLETYAIKDLNEMENVVLPETVNVFVLIDRIGGYDSSNGDWTGTRLYKVRHDTNMAIINSELLEDYGEIDMSSGKTLEDFIVLCQNDYPAQKTMLVLWNHGGGVYPRNITNRFRGICWDDTTGSSAWNCLTLDEIREALSNSFQSTNRKVDVLNMDACLTQMAEMVFEWEGMIDFLVGSQETVPGDGNDYDEILSALIDNPLMEAEELSSIIVQTYNEFYYNSNTTYSAFDMSDTTVNQFANAFYEFAETMYMSSDYSVMEGAKLNCQSFDYSENTDLKGISEYISENSTDSTLRTAANNLASAIDELVILSLNSGSYINNASGISILYPNASEWQNYSSVNQYRNLLISQNSFWDEFISEKLIAILD